MKVFLALLSKSWCFLNFNIKYLENKLKAQTFNGFQYCNRHSDISKRKYIILLFKYETIYETIFLLLERTSRQMTISKNSKINDKMQFIDTCFRFNFFLHFLKTVLYFQTYIEEPNMHTFTLSFCMCAHA